MSPISLTSSTRSRPAAILLLVLDDYHLIVTQAIHGAVAFLVDHLAENMHLVLAT